MKTIIRNFRKLLFAATAVLCSVTSWGQSSVKKTYCNPLDIDYTYMSHYRANADVSYRSGADPAVINFRN